MEKQKSDKKLEKNSPVQSNVTEINSLKRLDAVIEEEEMKIEGDQETDLEHQISNIFEKKESQVRSGN